VTAIPPASRPPRRSPLDAVRAAQARRKALYVERRGRAHRPTDQLGLAIDLVRGALADAPSPELAAREVDRLVREIDAATERLHAAAARAAKTRARTRRR